MFYSAAFESGSTRVRRTGAAVSSLKSRPRIPSVCCYDRGSQRAAEITAVSSASVSFWGPRNHHGACRTGAHTAGGPARQRSADGGHGAFRGENPSSGDDAGVSSKARKQTTVTTRVTMTDDAVAMIFLPAADSNLNYCIMSVVCMRMLRPLDRSHTRALV